MLIRIITLSLISEYFVLIIDHGEAEYRKRKNAFHLRIMLLIIAAIVTVNCEEAAAFAQAPEANHHEKKTKMA
jgi:hypothetical protein